MKPVEWIGSSYRDFIALPEAVQNTTGHALYLAQTSRSRSAIYVLHPFQKKSKKGIETPHEEIEFVRRRLRVAEEDDLARRRRGTK